MGSTDLSVVGIDKVRVQANRRGACLCWCVCFTNTSGLVAVRFKESTADNPHHFDVVRLKPLIDRTNGRHPCRIKRHNLRHKSEQGTHETDNSYESSDPRSRMCVPVYFTTSMNSHATYAVNLPDLIAVEPHWSPAHLLATLPASLLSMHQGLWRSCS